MFFEEVSVLELNHAVIPPPDLGLGLQPFNFRAIESSDIGGGEVDYLGEGGGITA